MDRHENSNPSNGETVYFAVRACDAAPLMRRLQDMVIAGRVKLASPLALAPRSILGGLTDRQRAVLDLLRQGLSNKQIGRTLGLSHFTVRNHVSQLLKLLDVPTRKAAITALDGHDGPAAPDHPSEG